MTTPMQLGVNNNATAQTGLSAHIPNATLVVQNTDDPVTGLGGNGMEVRAGSLGDGVRATGASGPDFSGVVASGGTGVTAMSTGAQNGVFAFSPLLNGVEGVSNQQFASGVYGENTGGGYGVAGRTHGNSSRAAVYGESTGAATASQGGAAGVWGYSENGYGGYFETGQAGGGAPLANSGGLRVIGDIVKTDGEYSEALPHPDGSQRLLYAPLSPESWFEDFGRAELVAGQAEVELDMDFVAVLGIEDGSYHVFLTPEGETGGLYISSRDARAFTVREQRGGSTNASFSYRVVAKNKHRQPGRLARFEEPAKLTRERRLLPDRGEAAAPPGDSGHDGGQSQA